MTTFVVHAHRPSTTRVGNDSLNKGGLTQVQLIDHLKDLNHWGWTVSHIETVKLSNELAHAFSRHVGAAA